MARLCLLMMNAQSHPCSNDTTHVLFSPLDFLSKLAALIPRPRYNVVKYHGVLAPNSTLRSCIVPEQRKKRKNKGKSGEKDNVSFVTQSKEDLLAPLTWAQRLTRVFRIDSGQCQRCGRTMRVITNITDPAVIQKFLRHLRSTPYSKPMYRHATT